MFKKRFYLLAGSKEKNWIYVLHIQTKPDYICKEDLLKELQEIEDNLNELEKRGVELEVKLRTCEEGEILLQVGLNCELDVHIQLTVHNAYVQ